MDRGEHQQAFKLSNIKEGKPLSLIKLNQIYLELESLTYEERLLKFELNPDRADVIIPAAKIYLKSLEWSGGQKIYVPKIWTIRWNDKIHVLKTEKKDLTVHGFFFPNSAISWASYSNSASHFWFTDFSSAPYFLANFKKQGVVMCF